MVPVLQVLEHPGVPVMLVAVLIIGAVVVTVWLSSVAGSLTEAVGRIIRAADAMETARRLANEDLARLRCDTGREVTAQSEGQAPELRRVIADLNEMMEQRRR
ncbi:MAG: hypothetical protein H7840_14500 [Alphaproteobacteria bacterium]